MIDGTAMLGKLVKVTVDRPMGSFHPKHQNLYYPVNYGYIEGILAPDGEEQDAYILGVDQPVKEFTGRIIGIVHRLDDIEEKWVVAPEKLSFTREQIQEQIYFSGAVFSLRDCHMGRRKAGIEYDRNKRKSGPPGRKERGEDAEKDEQEPWAAERFWPFKASMASGYADFGCGLRRRSNNPGYAEIVCWKRYRRRGLF